MSASPALQDYDDSFYRQATTGEADIFGWVAVAPRSGGGGGDAGAGGYGGYGASTSGAGGEELAGFVFAKACALRDCEAGDRSLLGLASPVDDAERCAYILTLGVAPRHRQRGLAAALVGRVVAAAEAARCAAVFLHVIAHNTAAQALYAKAGFGCAGALPSFYFINTPRQPAPGVVHYDALLFARRLAPPAGGAYGTDAARLPPPPSSPPRHRVSAPAGLAALALGSATAPLRDAWGMLTACMPWAAAPRRGGAPYSRTPSVSPSRWAAWSAGPADSAAPFGGAMGGGGLRPPPLPLPPLPQPQPQPSPGGFPASLRWAFDSRARG